jgi:hypothetical protein
MDTNNLIIKIKETDEHIKILVFSICILIICGILPSFFVQDWRWFARSGGLLVTYGIYIVWRDIKGCIHTALDRVDVAAKEKSEKEHEKISSLINNIQNDNKKLYNKIEFILLAVGTLIAAYGDLINSLYK